METAPRARLIELRRSRGYSQEVAAARIGVDVSTFGRWERGTQRIRDRNRLGLAAAFGLSMRQLLDLIDDPADAITPTATIPSAGRRIQGMRTYDTTPLDSLRSVIDGYRGLDHSVGPKGISDVVRSHLAVVEQMSDGSRSLARRSQLIGLTAQIHQLSGWMSFDTLDMKSARQSFDQARRSAEAADDPALLAYVLGPSAAFAEADYGQPARALDLVYAAHGHAHRSGNHRLLAFVQAITARVHAKLGDERLARSAVGGVRPGATRSRRLGI